MAYRDPLRDDRAYTPEPGFLDAFGSERAAFWRQVDPQSGSPRWVNTSAATLYAERDEMLFATLKGLEVTLTRLMAILDRRHETLTGSP